MRNAKKITAIAVIAAMLLSFMSFGVLAEQATASTVFNIKLSAASEIVEQDGDVLLSVSLEEENGKTMEFTPGMCFVDISYDGTAFTAPTAFESGAQFTDCSEGDSENTIRVATAGAPVDTSKPLATMKFKFKNVKSFAPFKVVTADFTLNAQYDIFDTAPSFADATLAITPALPSKVATITEPTLSPIADKYFGTALEDLGLPFTVEGKESDQTPVTVNIDWNGYKDDVKGTQTLTASLNDAKNEAAKIDAEDVKTQIEALTTTVTLQKITDGTVVLPEKVTIAASDVPSDKTAAGIIAKSSLTSVSMKKGDFVKPVEVAWANATADPVDAAKPAKYVVTGTASSDFFADAAVSVDVVVNYWDPNADADKKFKE